MKTKTMEEIRNYLLENPSERLEICKQINSYDGSMDFTNIAYIEELAETMNAYELARAIIYGDVNNIDGLVRFNGYGNLESVDEYDLESESKDYIEEIINHIDEYEFQNISNLDLECLYDDYEYLENEEEN